MISAAFRSGNGLKHCCKLHLLRLDHNLLGSVRAGELSSCSATLTTLDLSFNHLTCVEGVEALASLAELNLESNRLKDVPNLSYCRKVGCPCTTDGLLSVCVLKQLNELNLSGNSIQTHQLSNLKELQLKVSTSLRATVRPLNSGHIILYREVFRVSSLLDVLLCN